MTKTLNQLVRDAVIADGRPRRHIAAALEMHENYFSAFMTGRRQLTARTLDRVIKAIGKTPVLVDRK